MVLHLLMLFFYSRIEKSKGNCGLFANSLLILFHRGRVKLQVSECRRSCRLLCEVSLVPAASGQASTIRDPRRSQVHPVLMQELLEVSSRPLIRAARYCWPLLGFVKIYKEGHGVQIALLVTCAPLPFFLHQTLMI